MGKKPSLAETISEIDRLLRAGDRGGARARLRALRFRKIPRESLLEIARLAKRAQLASLGLRLLSPIIFQNRRKQFTPLPEELVEYAGLLIRAGAAEEAIEILVKVEEEKHPEALLHHALALITRWRYAESIPLFNRLLSFTSVSAEMRMVAETNLLAAHVHEENAAEANALFTTVLEKTALASPFMHGKVLVLQAEHLIYQREWRKAEESLEAASRRIQDAGGFDELFIRKWKLVLRLRRDGASPALKNEIEAIKKEAAEVSHWETVRDLDRNWAIATSDQDLLRHLYAGTPFDEYRRQLRKYLNPVPLEHIPHVWHVSPGKSSVEIDTVDAAGLTPGMQIHRFLVVLSSDFYRPHRLAPLFRQLHPDEHFNPITSPGRIHFLADRFRRWLKRSGLPLKLVQNKGGYKLEATRPVCLRVRTVRELPNPVSVILARLQMALKDSHFSAKEAARELELPERTVQRMLAKAVEKNLLERVGKGQATRYLFNPDPSRGSQRAGFRNARTSGS